MRRPARAGRPIRPRLPHGPVEPAPAAVVALAAVVLAVPTAGAAVEALAEAWPLLLLIAVRPRGARFGRAA